MKEILLLIQIGLVTLHPILICVSLGLNVCTEIKQNLLVQTMWSIFVIST